MSANEADGGRDKPDSELYVAAVSLAIALVALLGTVMQVLQQYYASATGFSNCDERVIGKWHEYKERIFRWKELRFEVRFKAPVIFVCPASNTKGPVKADVWIIDGSDRSQQETRTDDIKGHEPEAQGSSQDFTLLPMWKPTLRHRTTGTRTRNTATSELALAEKRIHTADNERATWLTMLTEFQRMELESDRWQREEYDWHRRKGQLPNLQPPQFGDRQLAVAVQAKPRSWDTMPPNIKKPYATTTMCHLVEMVAMLGLHWKEFDRSRDKYRAEGNGYVLTGSHLSDLGVVFTFQLSGKSTFHDNRIVPSTHVKELAFGLVPTIFRTREDERRLNFTAEEPRSQGFLLLGSTNELAETVAWFGCNTRTADILRDDTKKHGHLFPIAFELIGMLSKTLYLPNTSFRMVPNPTLYTWDTKFFNLRKLLAEFDYQLDSDSVAQPFLNAGGVKAEALDYMQPLQNQAEVVCDSLKRQQTDRGEQEFTLDLCAALDRSIAFCDDYLGRANQKLVQVVLREHIQEILRVVNSDDDETAPAGADGSRMSQLRDAAPEERHIFLMRIYFDDVLPRIVESLVRNLERRDTSILNMRSSMSPSPLPASLTPEPTSERLSTALTADESDSPGKFRPERGVPSPENEPGRHRPRRLASGLVDAQVTEIWCHLVFRMLCWLLLHDFHKNDRQVSSKSEVWGSRLPVYIG